MALQYFFGGGGGERGPLRFPWLGPTNMSWPSWAPVKRHIKRGNKLANGVPMASRHQGPGSAFFSEFSKLDFTETQKRRLKEPLLQTRDHQITIYICLHLGNSRHENQVFWKIHQPHWVLWGVTFCLQNKKTTEHWPNIKARKKGSTYIITAPQASRTHLPTRWIHPWKLRRPLKKTTFFSIGKNTSENRINPPDF